MHMSQVIHNTYLALYQRQISYFISLNWHDSNQPASTSEYLLSSFPSSGMYLQLLSSTSLTYYQGSNCIQFNLIPSHALAFIDKYAHGQRMCLIELVL